MLQVSAYDAEERTYRYEYLSEDLNRMSGFSAERFVASVQCAVNDMIYLSSVRSSVELDRNAGEVAVPSWVDPTVNMSRISVGCHVLSRKQNEEREFYGENNTYRVIDISTGETQSEFVLSTSFGRSHLFANGTRWLMQRELQHEDGRQEPTREFTLVDTVSGEILLEGELDIGNAMIPYSMDSRRFCSPGSDEERIIAKDGLTIYLIDAYTLSVLASMTLPFEDGFYVF